MAGDWIKVENVTPDKPEIVKMASVLGIDQDAVLGKLVRLWIWADCNSVDGNDVSVTDSFIDRLTFQKGFAIALRNVGWLTGKNGCLMLPNFDRHNGQTSKNRANTNRRVAKHRVLCNDDSVTNSLQKPLPETEKRREEYSNMETTVNQLPKRIDDVVAFMGSCLESPKGDQLKACANSFYDDFSARGWVDIRGIPLRDWKPAARKYARTWAHNNASKAINHNKQNSNQNREYR